MKKFIIFIYGLMLFLGSCITPRFIIEKVEDVKSDGKKDIIVIFEDGLNSGGYTYAYPESTSKIRVVEEEKKDGDAGLEVVLDEKTYSGAAVGFGNLNFSDFRSTGALEFWVKGSYGDEVFQIALLDSEQDGFKVATLLSSKPFVKVTKEWQKVSIPLYKFGDAGKYWDGRQEIGAIFDWKNVTEVRFSIVPQGTKFKIWVDNIVVVPNAGFNKRTLSEIELITKDEQQDGCSIGIFGEGFQNDLTALNALEKTIGKKFSMVMWYIDWQQPFPEEQCQKLTEGGYLPHIVWEAWFFNDQNRIKLDNIINGEWDSYIIKWAQDAAKWGKPLFLRWGHEFNGNWYPWSIAQNGKDPAKYIAAYRHIHDIFVKVNATNVKWLWSPNNNSVPQEDWNDPLKAYPGDKYVDWLAPDGYNFGTAGGSGKWLGFNDIFQNIYITLVKNFDKPIMIGEYATGPEGGFKSKWIENMGEELEKNYPAIKAVVWFNINKETDWRLDDEPETIESARKVFRKPYFLSEYKNLISHQTKYKEKISEYRKKVEDIVNKYNIKPIIEAKKRVSPPSFNGKKSEYNEISPVILDKGKDIMAFGGLWDGTNNLKAEVRFSWDENSFYVFADVVDNFPMINPNKGQDIWNGDCLEIAICTDPLADPKRIAFGPYDFQIGITPGDLETKIPPQIWCWTLNRTLNDVKVFSLKTMYGYILEVALPWKELKNFIPSENMILSFTFAIDDGDADKKRSSQSIWFGDDSFYKNPSVWGKIKLIR